MSYRDLREVGLLGSTSQQNAALQALFEWGAQIGRRGEPRLSPTPPPLDLGAVQRAYQASMTGEMKRNLLARKERDKEEKRKRLKLQRELFDPVPADPQAAQLMAAQAAAPLAQRLAAGTEAEKTMVREMADPAALEGDLKGWYAKQEEREFPHARASEAYPGALASETERLLPAALKATTMSPALQGIPAALRPFTQKLVAASPEKGMDFVTKILAAQTKYRPLKTHSVLLNGKPAMLTSEQYRAAVARDDKITPIPRAVPSVNVNYGDKTPGILAGLGKTAIKGAYDRAATAGFKLTQLAEMGRLLESGVPTGRLSSWAIPFKNMFAEFGVVNENLPVQEAINSLGSKLALAEHGPGMGPMTDADFKIYQKIVPGLENTRAGNSLIMHVLKRQYRGHQMYASLLYNKLKETGAQTISPKMMRNAWAAVARRLNDELGPLFPRFKNEDDFKKAIKAGRLAIPRGGKVMVIGGKALLRELR